MINRLVLSNSLRYASTNHTVNRSALEAGTSADILEQFLQYEPPIRAVLSDKEAQIEAVFSEEAVRAFEQSNYKKRITSETQGCLVKIHSCELVVWRRSASDTAFLMIEDCKCMGAAGSHIFGRPKSLLTLMSIQSKARSLLCCLEQQARHPHKEAAEPAQSASSTSESAASQRAFATQVPLSGRTMTESADRPFRHAATSLVATPERSIFSQYSKGTPKGIRALLAANSRASTPTARAGSASSTPTYHGSASPSERGGLHGARRSLQPPPAQPVRPVERTSTPNDLLHERSPQHKHTATAAPPLKQVETVAVQKQHKSSNELVAQGKNLVLPRFVYFLPEQEG